MAWTPPRDWANGEIPTQTEFNTHVRDQFRELWHEVAYTEFSADVSVTASAADVVSSGAITYPALPIIVEFFAARMDGGGNDVRLLLRDGATELGIIGSTTQSTTVLVRRRLTPTAASHTYKISALTVSGAATIKAGAGGSSSVFVPGYIRILQRGG